MKKNENIVADMKKTLRTNNFIATHTGDEVNQKCVVDPDFFGRCVNTVQKYQERQQPVPASLESLAAFLNGQQNTLKSMGTVKIERVQQLFTQFLD